MTVQVWRDEIVSQTNDKNDEELYPEYIGLASALKGRNGNLERRL